jgi:integrase
MATIEKRRNGYRLVFWYRGERFQGAIKTRKQSKAEELKKRVEGNLELLLQGRLDYRPGTDDLFTLMLSDGRLNAKPEAAHPLSISEFFQHYAENRPPSKEKNTAYTEQIHVEHLLRLLGKGTHLADVPRKLQDYVNARSKEDGLRGDTVSHVTIRKELGTLSSIWNKWGMNRQLVPGPLSLRNLEYPKRTEKEPFQTWEQIERRIARGRLSAEQQEQAWGSLYLTLPQIGELLTHVRKSKFGWAYPMFVFCAHTGARRSEMLRSRVEDFDFDRNEVTIREKKKDRTKKEPPQQNLWAKSGWGSAPRLWYKANSIASTVR